jgi:hypothetical protein
LGEQRKRKFGDWGKRAGGRGGKGVSREGIVEGKRGFC